MRAEEERGTFYFSQNTKAESPILFPPLSDGGTLMTQTIYEVAGGRQAFLDLAHAWHERCLADPIVSHAFSHGYHPQHTERLAAYGAEALGGPPDYTRAMGNESNAGRMHS